MVQTAEVRDRDDGAVGLQRDGSRHWRVFVERKMGPGSQVILCVGVQHVPQPAGIDHQDVVETFAPNRSDQALRIGVGVSRQLHRRRAVRRKPFELHIPSIRYMGTSSN